MPRLHGKGKSVTSWDNQYDDISLADWLAYDFDYTKIIKLMHPHPGMDFLDIACGSGELLAHALDFELAVTGIENKPESAAVSQKNAPQANVILGSLQEIPFEDNHFDLITCFKVTDFFSNPAGAMREIFRVLKPGGRTCIVLPNSEFVGLRSKKQQIQYEEFDVFYPMETWKKMLAATGLILIDIRFTTQHQIEVNHRATWLQKAQQWFKKLLVKLFPKSYATQFICVCQKVH